MIVKSTDLLSIPDYIEQKNVKQSVLTQIENFTVQTTISLQNLQKEYS